MKPRASIATAFVGLAAGACAIQMLLAYGGLFQQKGTDVPIAGVALMVGIPLLPVQYLLHCAAIHFGSDFSQAAQERLRRYARFALGICAMVVVIEIVAFF